MSPDKANAVGRGRAAPLMRDVRVLLVKAFISIGLATFLTLSFPASAIDVMALLDRDLGGRIKLKAHNEIWFCPDNTCNMYRTSKANADLPTFVYLHLFHESGYIFLDERISGANAFRKLAMEEPQVRNSVSDYCVSSNKTPSCILIEMQKKLNIEISFARYDEGNLCFHYSDTDNGCQKL